MLLVTVSPAGLLLFKKINSRKGNLLLLVAALALLTGATLTLIQ